MAQRAAGPGKAKSPGRGQPSALVSRPSLERIAALKSVLQAFRSRLDDELEPFGITTAQLRLLWAVQENPGVSGAKIARLCGVTPQTGQMLMLKMEAAGWVRRSPSAASERVLVAVLTASGRRVLLRAREVAARLDRMLWQQATPAELRTVDAVLARAAARLSLGQKP